MENQIQKVPDAKVQNFFNSYDNSDKLFYYNGNPITFNVNGKVMVNATEMAKPFGKLPKDWLYTKQAKELINSLSAKRGIPLLADNELINSLACFVYNQSLGSFPKGLAISVALTITFPFTLNVMGFPL
jgi:hypothetical protein